MTQPEARLQRRIAEALKARGIPCWRLRPMGLSGWPDLYAIKDGRAIHIEVKMPGNYPTKLQIKRIEEFSRAGAIAGWVDSVEGALKLVGGG